MKQIKPGEKYIHFKNKEQEYEILAIAKHSDNQELMVIYQALYGEKIIWCRPLEEFVGVKKLDDGTTVKRFKLIN
jgi:hypothetical protein